ncbi:MAG: roadblock/LC7 domain-containing protein [candidate division WOR-3 bacterium]|nr:roadblock/LC7 domain-containing protein [candidate division WOR-3 bacterium]
MLGLEGKLRGILSRLNQAAPEIQASAVVSMDGLMLASAMPPNTHDDDVAAIAATLLGLGDKTVQEFQHGRLQQVYVKGDRGYTIITNTGQDNVLVVVTDENVKLGIIFLHIKLAAKEITHTFLHLLDAPDQSAPPPTYPT